MKELKLRIKIDRPPETVFQFALNPKNTPGWIDSIVEEETSEWPVKQGTRYRNRSAQGDWTEYELVEYEPPKMFLLSRIGTPYRVRYTVTPSEGSSELEYHEWVEHGELEEPFDEAPLVKLKNIIEASH